MLDPKQPMPLDPEDWDDFDEDLLDDEVWWEDDNWDGDDENLIDA